MRYRMIHRFLANFIIVFISMSLIVSCAPNTKTVISKKFDKSKSQIAIMTFTSSGENRGSDSYISDKLTFALIEKGFSVIEREKIQNVFSELQLGASGALSKNDLNRIGKLSGVDIICFGSSYYQMSAKGYIWPYRIIVRLIDVTSGDVVFMAECKNDDWDGTYCVNQISEELSKAVK